MKIGDQIQINGKTLVIVGRDGSDFIAMAASANGAIREYLVNPNGKCQRIN